MTPSQSMITLDRVTKVYPASVVPAVDNVSFEVPEGETCVLIGPSGSGKTTTLKMVNRLIEPSSGTIYINGENILQMDPVILRRGIGYVIQRIGLFPHMTIAENIAVVPELLDWEPRRIAERVSQLLELVGLDPDTFRDRYPRQLSGGQRQRVGVARALAADPPVMLMDEPFGAIDPITRDRLQNEFLRLQKRIQKTVMFVTHDIDEAIKMGTRICILRQGGIMAQYDTPRNILAAPADKFVADFVGADRGLKRLNLINVGEIMQRDIQTGRADESTFELLERMRRQDLDSLLIVDDAGKLVGFVSLETVQQQADRPAGEVVEEIIASTEEEATIRDVFSEMLSYGVSYMPVLGEQNRLAGIITVDRVQTLIQQPRKGAVGQESLNA